MSNKQSKAPTEHLDPVQKQYPAGSYPSSGHGATTNAGLSASELPKGLKKSGVSK